MKKPAAKRTRKTRSPKRASAARGGAGSAGAQLLEELDPSELLALQEAMGLSDDERSATELLARFLDLCAFDEPDDDELSWIGGALIEVLDKVRIDGNDGLRQARDEREDILQMIDDAAESDQLQGVAAMSLSRILTEAGWPTPEVLKQAAVASLEQADFVPASPEQLKASLTSSLAELVQQVDGDGFALQAQLSSIMAAFPNETAAELLHVLASEAEGTLALAFVGFALHPDQKIAVFVLDGLAAISGRSVDSRLVERLVRMRTWVPEARRAAADAAVRALRPKVGAPVMTTADELRKIRMTVSDGSGGRSLVFATHKGRAHNAFAVLIKTQGVAEILCMDDIGKAEVDALFEQVKSSAASSDADLAGAQRMLGLALADNLAAGVPPPYELVRLVERLGLGPLTPDTTSAVEAAAELLANLLPLEADAETLAQAHAAVIGSATAQSWFEAGETIENLLAPARTKKQRVDALEGADDFEVWRGARNV